MKRLLVLLTFIVLVCPAAAHAAIVHIQTGGTACDPGTQCTAAFPSNTISGDLIVVAIASYKSGSPATFTVNDGSCGNTYTQAVAVNDGANFTSAIFYAKNIHGCTSHQVTVVPDGTAQMTVSIHEYNGADPTNPLDQTASTVGAGTTVTSGTVTTTADGLVFGTMTENAGGAITPGATYTERYNAGGLLPLSSEDKVVWGYDTYTADWTVAANTAYYVAIASFREPGSGGGGGGGTPPSSMSHVQSHGAKCGAVTLCSTAFLSTTVSGDLVVVGIASYKSVSPATFTVTDSCGNAYTQAIAVNDGANFSTAIFYAKNITGCAAHQVYVAPDDTAQVEISIHEYSGADTTNPLDQTTSTVGTGTSVSSGTITTTAAGLVFGAMTENAGGTITHGAAYTERYNLGGLLPFSSEDRLAAPGTYDAEWTVVSNTAYYAAVASFKEASGGGGSSGPPTISSVTPPNGSVGETVTITGTNFAETQGTSTVTFNGVPATVSSWSATSITTTVPSGTTAGNLVVSVGGSVSNAIAFSTEPWCPEAPRQATWTGSIGPFQTVRADLGMFMHPCETFRATLTVRNDSNSFTIFAGTLNVGTGWFTGAIFIAGHSSYTTDVPGYDVLGGPASSQRVSSMDLGSALNVPLTYSLTAYTTPRRGSNGEPYSPGEAYNRGEWSCPGTIEIPAPGQLLYGTLPDAVSRECYRTTVPPHGSVTLDGTVTNISGVYGADVGAIFRDANFNQLDICHGGAQVSPGQTAVFSPCTYTNIGDAPQTVYVDIRNNFWGFVEPFAINIRISGLGATLTSITPGEGRVNSAVTLNGAGFGEVQGTGSVTFNGVTAQVIDWDDGQIRVLVPPTATSGPVVVTTGAGASAMP